DLIDGAGEVLRRKDAEQAAILGNRDKVCRALAARAAEDGHPRLARSGDLEVAVHDALHVAVAFKHQLLCEGLTSDGANQSVTADDRKHVLKAVDGAVE